jgi:hypothetical protein
VITIVDDNEPFRHATMSFIRSLGYAVLHRFGCEGRWKMVIIFHLFDRLTLRFSELERTISGVSQKMAAFFGPDRR